MKLLDSISNIIDKIKLWLSPEIKKGIYAEQHNDYKTALRIYNRLARAGNAEAMYRLSGMYLWGNRVERDEAQSIRWLIAAGEHGDMRAQGRLGSIYRQGGDYGIQADKVEAIRWYRMAALQGDGESQYRMGEAYRLGQGVEPDEAEALRWYTLSAAHERDNDVTNIDYLLEALTDDPLTTAKLYNSTNGKITFAAISGVPRAQARLGTLYRLGYDNVDKNYAESVKWYRSAAEQGDAQGQKGLGDMYYHGYGVERDRDKAMRLWGLATAQGDTKAENRLRAEQGDPAAQAAVAKGYSYGDNVERDYTEALRWYRLSAEQGYPDAQRRLGDAYCYGLKGVDEDHAEAARWYTLAANSGHILSMLLLGDMYRLGDGVERDYTEAMRLYQLAAGHDDPQAQYRIGNMYRMGYGVDRDEAEALRWYELAAAQDDDDANEILSAFAGDTTAQGEVGKYHYDRYYDYHQQEELDEAIKWLTPAAEQDIGGDIQYMLGAIYYTGNGVDRDYAKALMYFSMAAKQWHSSAHDRLGDMYRYGHGVPQDNITAYAWYSLAAHDGGDDDAIRAIEELNQEMSPDDITKAKVKAEKRRSSN